MDLRITEFILDGNKLKTDEVFDYEIKNEINKSKNYFKSNKVVSYDHPDIVSHIHSIIILNGKSK